MKQGIKQPITGQILRDWLNAVPYGDYNVIKERMVAECMVSKAIFWNWVAGLTKIPKLAQHTINIVAMNYNGSRVFNINDYPDKQKQELAGQDVDGESNVSGEAL